MTWDKICLPIIRKIVPQTIAQEIVGVQPMSLPDNVLSTLFKSSLVFSKFATNSDGYVFKFTSKARESEIEKSIIINVTYLNEYHEYIEICDVCCVFDDCSEDDAKRIVEKSLIRFVEQIDDLTLQENFNKSAATLILKEEQQQRRV